MVDGPAGRPWGLCHQQQGANGRIRPEGASVVVTVQDDGNIQIEGRAAAIIKKVAELASQLNAEYKGSLTFHFAGDSLTVVRQYHEEPMKA